LSLETPKGSKNYTELNLQPTRRSRFSGVEELLKVLLSVMHEVTFGP